MDYMRLLMAADCLIKSAEAGLKEPVGTHDTVTIPEAVGKEVVEAGKDTRLLDAVSVEMGIYAKRVRISSGFHSHTTGAEVLRYLVILSPARPGTV